jgi:hypothetical protein
LQTFFAQLALNCNSPDLSPPSSMGWQVCTTVPRYWPRSH